MYGSTVDTCTVLLGGFEESGKEARCFKCSRLGQQDVSLGEEAKVFLMFASLKVESEAGVGELPVVCEFPDIFLKDIVDLPHESSEVCDRCSTWN